MKKLLATLAVGAAALALSQGAQAACGPVVISNMNWASAELLANVDKIILSKGYGCEASLVPGDTMPTFTSMNEKGQPDVAPELWANFLRDPLGKAMKEGRLHTLNKGPILGIGEGWWIPRHTAEKHPELKTVLDILKRPDLFPYKEDPSKGAFVNCPAGWGCQLTNSSLFRAFEMKKKGWVLVDPGSAAGLDGSMAKAVERGQNWFGYYWAPTALVGKYGPVKVPFGVPFVGSEHWDGCIVKPEQECAAPKPSAWTKSEVYTVVSDRFMKNGGVAIDYLKARVFPGDVINAMLAYMQANQASGEEAAQAFLRKHESVWTKWVSADTAAKVKSSL